LPQAYDVVIVGGGAAGLSAALVLGRCRRSILVCDDGRPRNEVSPAVHCLLGNEGIGPSELLAKGRNELREYKSVALHDDEVLAITKADNQFTMSCLSGLTVTARKVLLTTGVKDEVPTSKAFRSCTGGAYTTAPTATVLSTATNHLGSTAKVTRGPDLR
jgi:thioredoxin reductase